MNLPGFSIRKPVTVLMLTMVVILFWRGFALETPVELLPHVFRRDQHYYQRSRASRRRTSNPSDAFGRGGRSDCLQSGTAHLDIQGRRIDGGAHVPTGNDMDFAALEVREKFAKIKNLLPKDIESR